jgi:hypothetical protein
MAPKQSGETLTPAFGERILYLARGDTGSGALANAIVFRSEFQLILSWIQGHLDRLWGVINTEERYNTEFGGCFA